MTSECICPSSIMDLIISSKLVSSARVASYVNLVPEVEPSMVDTYVANNLLDHIFRDPDDLLLGFHVGQRIEV